MVNTEGEPGAGRGWSAPFVYQFTASGFLRLMRFLRSSCNPQSCPLKIGRSFELVFNNAHRSSF